MKRYWILGTLVIVVVMTILPAFAIDGSSLKAEEQPGLTAPQSDDALANNNDFACTLFRTINDLKQDDNSFVVSPISVSYLLGMLHEGAEGKTRQQIHDVLGLDGSVEEINTYFKNMMDYASNADAEVTVKTANCIDIITGQSLRPQYKADMQNYYNAQIDAVDYDDMSILSKINNWCKKNTDGMIPEILKKGDLNPNRVMYLLNAVYFKATWTTPFSAKGTREMDFMKQNGSTVKRQMMHLKTRAAYGKNDLCEMLRLNYGNGGYSMCVLLPRAGKTIDDIIQSLSAERLEQQRKREMHSHEVDILIPRFTTESETHLEGILSSMGMPRAFSRTAEFPNMLQDHEDDIFVSMMKQKAKIEVNEEGTEAAAVTVAEMSVRSASIGGPKIVQFHATHPFVYYIVENSTGAIFFMGTYCGDEQISN